MLLIEQN